jgi:hypothetical protein
LIRPARTCARSYVERAVLPVRFEIQHRVAFGNLIGRRSPRSLGEVTRRILPAHQSPTPRVHADGKKSLGATACQGGVSPQAIANLRLMQKLELDGFAGLVKFAIACGLTPP